MSTFWAACVARCGCCATPGVAVIGVSPSLSASAPAPRSLVVNGVLLNPLPYPRSGELVTIYRGCAGVTGPMSYLNFLDWQRMSRTFCRWRSTEIKTTVSPAPAGRRVTGMVSAGFFRTLGRPSPVATSRLTIASARRRSSSAVVLAAAVRGSPPLNNIVTLNGQLHRRQGHPVGSRSMVNNATSLHRPVEHPSFRDRGGEVSTHAIAGSNRA
jgi:hypothetical protein